MENAHPAPASGGLLPELPAGYYLATHSDPDCRPMIFHTDSVYAHMKGDPRREGWTLTSVSEATRPTAQTEAMVSIPLRHAKAINGGCLPLNPNKMRSVDPEVVEAVRAFKNALTEATRPAPPAQPAGVSAEAVDAVALLVARDWSDDQGLRRENITDPDWALYCDQARLYLAAAIAASKGNET